LFDNEQLVDRLKTQSAALSTSTTKLSLLAGNTGTKLLCCETMSFGRSLVGDWISKNDLEIVKPHPSQDLKDFDLFEEIYATKLETFLVMNLVIQHLSLSDDTSELSLQYRSSSSSSTPVSRRLLRLTHLNLLPTSHGPVFAVVLNIDPAFQSLSSLLMGPLPGFRIFEQYKLSGDGSELLSHISITSRLKGGTITVKKQYSRLPNSESNSSGRLSSPFSRTECESVCCWKTTKSHSGATLRSAVVTIAQPDPVISEDGSTVLFYPICVTLSPDRHWTVHYRYSQIRQLKKYLRQEIDQLIALGHLPPHTSLPHFPPREMGTLSNRALEERRIALEIFLDSVTQSGGYDCQDIVDLLAAFFEVPPSPLMRPSAHLSS
jgi:hypothetical protein